MVTRPFLTVETGEAYQPLRLTYKIQDLEAFEALMDKLSCLEKNLHGGWSWFWRDECEEQPFDSIDTYVRNPLYPLRLGIFTLKDSTLTLNLSSFKRACLAVPLFHRLLAPTATVTHADFLNKVYGVDESLPRGFSEHFNEAELSSVLERRAEDYQKIEQRCAEASDFDVALQILSEYADQEARKKLAFAERYSFNLHSQEDPDIIFLGFYVFLRSRELVAIRRWFGETTYTLAKAAEETVEQVFGNVGLDIIE